VLNAFCYLVAYMASENEFNSNDFVKQTFETIAYDFEQFSLDDFVVHIQEIRGRNILLIPYPFAPEITGLWIPRKSIDFIFYKSNTHMIYQTHIILHELAHMLLDHPLKPIRQIISPAILMEFGIEPHGYLRAIYGQKDIYEKEAEAFVHLVQQQVVRARRLIELTTGDTSISQFKPFIRGVPFQDNYWTKKR
jgi:hypothetical protein